MKKVSIEDLTRLAESDSARAQYELARMFERGERIQIDREAALDWYARAASNGMKEAAVSAGDLYKKIGRYEDAFNWYEKSARDGYVEAEWRLGVLYEEGKGCIQNYERAKEWYEKAYISIRELNDQCDSKTQDVRRERACQKVCWLLGRIYDLGLCGSHDSVKAEECYEYPFKRGYTSDWYLGEEYADLYYRYAEIMEKKDTYKALTFYEFAVQAGRRGAKEAYIRFRLKHLTYDDGEIWRWTATERAWLYECADKECFDALSYLAKENSQYALKLSRLQFKLYRLQGNEKTLNALIEYYATLHDDTVDSLKGRRLCAVLRNRAKGLDSICSAGKMKQQMVSTFKYALNESKGQAEACYQIYQWAKLGLLTESCKKDVDLLEIAVKDGLSTAIDEKERIENEKACIEKAKCDRIVKMLLEGKWAYSIDRKQDLRVLKELERLANDGSVIACKVLVSIYGGKNKRLAPNPIDAELALKWQLKAAKMGDKESIRAICEANADVDDRDRFEFNLILAEDGDAPSILRCAKMLECGCGCNKDIVQAVEYYEKVSHLVDAKRQLVEIYSKGLGVPEDVARAGQLELEILAQEPVESRFAAVGILTGVLEGRYPVNIFANSIRKAIAFGDPYFDTGNTRSSSPSIVNSQMGDSKGIGETGGKQDEDILQKENVLSCIRGDLTNYLLHLFLRQNNFDSCRNNLFRLYSLSGCSDISAYRDLLEKFDTTTTWYNTSPTLFRIMREIDSPSSLTYERYVALLQNGGVSEQILSRVLSVLDVLGTKLREPFKFLDNGRYQDSPEFNPDHRDLRIQKSIARLLRSLAFQRTVSGHLNRLFNLKGNLVSAQVEYERCGDRQEQVEWERLNVVDISRLLSSGFSHIKQEYELETKKYEETISELQRISSFDAEELYWLKRYSERGDVRVAYICGRLFLDRTLGTRNLDLAEWYLNQGVSLGSSDCMCLLGHFYSTFGKRSFARAAIMYRKAYDLDCVEAASHLGDLCFAFWLAGDLSSLSEAYSDLAEGPLLLSRAVAALDMNDYFFVMKSEDALRAALNWYSIGAKAEDARACFKLGVFTVKRYVEWGDERTGLAMLEKAVSLGLADAAEFLALRGWCLPSGVLGERSRIVSYFRVAVALGSPRALELYDRYLKIGNRIQTHNGDDEVLLKDWPLGVCNSGIHCCDMIPEYYWHYSVDLKKKAEDGHAVAMFKFGCMLYYGYQADYCGKEIDFVEKDPDTAAMWFQRSAIAGYVPAITMLGIISERQREFDAGLRWFRKASMLGDGFAGWRIYKDRVSALVKGKLYFKDFLHDTSPISLWGQGYCLEHGIGVSKSHPQAYACYSKSASAGFTPGMVSMAKFLLYGFGTEKDVNRAFTYFSEAACRGDIGGIYFLGWCYTFGNGCEIDYPTAYTLFVEAARHGNVSAKLEAVKLRIKGKCSGYFVKNEIVARAVCLPRIFSAQICSDYSVERRDDFDVGCALRDLVDLGNEEAIELAKHFKGKND